MAASRQLDGSATPGENVPMNARVEQIIRSLDASEAKKQAEERRRNAELRELVAAVDERDRSKSGLSPEEWAALKPARASAREALRAARQQAKDQQAAAVAAFCESHAPAAVLGLPDATAVALALSEKHVGGKAMRMAQLLQEAPLATTEDAGRVSKSRVGKDLAVELRRLNWTHRQRGTGPVWIPPITGPAVYP